MVKIENLRKISLDNSSEVISFHPAKLSLIKYESTTIAAFSTSKSSSELKGSLCHLQLCLPCAFKLSPLQNKSGVRVDISIELKVGLTFHSNGGEI